MNDLMISVLVPMYNASSTILRCLETLSDQCGTIAEIVVLDDGSTDDCFQKAKEMEKKNPKIRVYSQENQGVSYTRQQLIKLAKGKYIMFCDADDYFEKDAIGIVYKDIIDMDDENSPDVFIYGYNLVRNYGNKTVALRELDAGLYSKKEFSSKHVTSLGDLYWSALWNKCYKKELCLNPEIKFETLMEDVLFNLDYFSNCKRAYISKHIIYNYVQIGESLTRTKKTDTRASIMEADNVYTKLYEKAQNAYPTEYILIVEHVYMLYCSLCDRAKKIDAPSVYKTVTEHKASLQNQLGLKVVRLDAKRIYMKIKALIRSKLK